MVLVAARELANKFRSLGLLLRETATTKMSIIWIIPVGLTLLVIREVMTGSAFSLRTRSAFRGGMDQFDSTAFVDKDEHPVAFWMIIVNHSVFIVFIWWRSRDHLW